MSTRPFALPLALTLFSVTLSVALRAEPAKFPCTLATDAEVKAIAGTETIGAGTFTAIAGDIGLVCDWNWKAKEYSPSLEVVVSELSKTYPGTSPALIKEGLLGGPRGLAPNQTLIPGVGEAAVYTQEGEKSVHAIALLKDKMLTIGLSAPDAPSKKDLIIALVKSAAARM